MNKAQSLRMNFWTPEFSSWGHSLRAESMPWYVLYDYVEVYKYDAAANEFHLHWRDDFNIFDAARWRKANGSFEANSSVFHTSNVYTEGGNLVLKMEPTDGQAHTASKLTHFVKEPLHAKEAHYHQQADGIEIPAVHDAFLDSHLFGKHETHSDRRLLGHHSQEYVDHHDDYYRDAEGALFVDHHDVEHTEHVDDWRVDRPSTIPHPHSHEHAAWEHEHVHEPEVHF